MEETRKWKKGSFLAVLWILLFALPCAALVEVPSEVEWDIPGDAGPTIVDTLWVYGTANILTGAHITQEVGAWPGSEVNIYGGQIDWWLATYTNTDPTDNPNVTIYGDQFRIGSGSVFSPPADPIISYDTLYVLSESEVILFSFIVFSDIPIHLRAPDVEPPENQQPVADAGPDLTVFTKDIASTVIDGTATDPDEGDSLHYRWVKGSVEFTLWAPVGANGAPLNLGDILPQYLGVGPHTLTLEVTDGTETVSDDMVLTIEYAPITIDIKPNSYPNCINLGSHGVVPVAILSTAEPEFDATLIPADTVFLAGSGVRVRGKGNKYLASEEDIDGDGLLDLVVKVETENLDPGLFAEGGAYLTVNETDDPESNVIYRGWDEITIVPPE